MLYCDNKVHKKVQVQVQVHNKVRSRLDNDVKFREMIKFDVVWRTRTPEDKFQIFSLNVYTVLTNFILEMWTEPSDTVTGNN